MNKGFIKLITRVLLLGVILFVIDRGLGWWIEKMYYSEKQGDSFLTTYGLDKAHEDVLIFGTSRASHHYVPALFEDFSGMSTYNLGRDGIKFDYDYALITGVLNRYSPKVIIIDLNQNDFVKDPADPKNSVFTTTFLPYVNKNKFIDKMVFEVNPSEERFAKISRLYSFNSLLAPIIQHHLGIGQKNQGGYEALKGSKVKEDQDISTRDNNDYKENKALTDKFEKVIDLLEQRKIKYYIIYSPILQGYKNTPIPFANKVLEKYSMRVIDFRNNITFNKNTKLFHDEGHLNDSGARIFTQQLLKDSIKLK